MLVDHLQTTPPQMRPLAPHMWLLLVQMDVGLGSGTVVLGVLTDSVGSEATGSAFGAGAVSASWVGWLASSWWDLSDRDIVGISEGEVGSSRVSSVGLASSGATTLVEVTVGRGGRVLPDASTVRMVVLLMVGPGGVTVTTRVVGVWVLDSLVDAVPKFLIISASSDTPALIDWLVEVLEDEIEVVSVVLVVVLKVVLSTTEA